VKIAGGKSGREWGFSSELSVTAMFVVISSVCETQTTHDIKPTVTT